MPYSPGAVYPQGSELSPEVSGHSLDRPHTLAVLSEEASGSPDSIQMS